MKAILSLILLGALSTAPALAEEAASSVRKLHSVTCKEKTGRTRGLALIEYDYDLGGSPEALFSYQVAVWSVESTKDQADRNERVWQLETTNMKGAHPDAYWSGTILCGEAGAAFVFLVKTYGLEVEIKVYRLDVSQRSIPTLPRPETLKTLLVNSKDMPHPVADLSAYAETCRLDKIQGSFDQGYILLSMSNSGEPCKHFQVTFDASRNKFVDLPKEWSKVVVK